MELERIVVLILLVLAPLANLLIQLWQKQQERKPVPAPAPALPPTPVPVKKPAARAQRRAVRQPAPTVFEPPPVVTARVRKGSSLSLRRAIVFSEIVGPCRAMRPYERS